ncbi:tandem-95 repeat protein [Shewanella sp. A25]|nr:tandem-95 repeat protein [Shewanella shenzhenensis]
MNKNYLIKLVTSTFSSFAPLARTSPRPDIKKTGFSAAPKWLFSLKGLAAACLLLCSAMANAGISIVSVGVTTCDDDGNGVFTSTLVDCLILNTDIDAYLNSGISVTVDNQDTVNGLSIESNISKATGSASTLTFKSARTIIVKAKIITTGNPLNIILWSDTKNLNVAGVVFTGTDSSGPLNTFNTAGGHIWIGGTSTADGSSTWNGLTVGNGPSVGSDAGNHNALDVQWFDFNTSGGDVLLWAGAKSVSDGGAVAGLAVFPNTTNQINAGTGDITIIADAVKPYNSATAPLLISTTGHFTLLPNTSTQALGWQHDENASGNLQFSGEYNLLKFASDFRALTGFTLGDYTGMSGVDLGYQGVVTLTNDIITNGPISVYGGGVNQANTSAITATNGDIILDADTGIDLPIGNVVMTINGTITTNTSGNITLVSRTPSNANLNAMSFAGASVSSAGTLTVSNARSATATNGSRGLHLATSSYSANGDIVFDGSSGAQGSYDVNLSNSTVISTNGNITFVAQGVQANDVFNIEGTNTVTASSGGIITFRADRFGVGGNDGTAITTTGAFIVEPTHASFDFDSDLNYGELTEDLFTWSGSGSPDFTLSGILNNVVIKNIASLGGLVLGKSTNTGGMTLASATTLNGPVSVYGSVIQVNGALTTTSATSSGNVLLQSQQNVTTVSSPITANGSITMTGGGDITVNAALNTTSAGVNGNISLKALGKIDNVGGNIITNGGSVIFWADADGSNDGLIQVGNIATSGGHIWLGGGAGSATWHNLSVGDGYASATSGNAGIFYGAGGSVTHNTGGGDYYAAGRIAGSGASNLAHGIWVRGGAQINTGIGNVTLLGDVDVNVGASITNTAGIGMDGGSSITTTTGNIDITGSLSEVGTATNKQAIWLGLQMNSPSGALPQLVTTSGNVALEGVGGDIHFDIVTPSAISGLLSLETDTSLTIGNTINTAGAFSATADTISQTASVTAADGVTFNSTNTTFDTQDAITVSAAVDGGSGDISITSQTGDIVVGANLTTSATSATAITLNAGDTAAAGTGTGGDVLLQSGIYTTGNGGNINIYTGTVADSTGVSDLASGDNGAAYYNSDGTNLTLIANVNAVYRQATPPMPKALDFDGANDFVNLPTSGWSSLTTALTIETWVKFDSTANSDLITRHDASPAVLDLFWGLRYRGNGVLIHVSNGSNHYRCQSTSSPADDGLWHHVAGIFESGVGIKFYIDGVEEAGIGCVTLGTGLNLTIANAGTQARIGAYNDGSTLVNIFNGQLDEMRVWNVVRTEQQIRDNMFRTIPSNSTGLLAYYQFDATSGTTLTDATGSGHSGTLINMDGNADWVDTAAYNTWLGYSSDWTDANNWSLQRAPVATDNVGITSKMAVMPDIVGNPTVNHFGISSTSSPTLSSAMAVTGNFFLTPNLDLNGQTIDLGSTGYLYEQAGIIFDSLGTGEITTTRSLSNISAQNIAGLGATLTTAANLGSTTVSRSHGVGFAGIGIKRVYDITPTNDTGLNGTLVFHYDDSELNGLTEADLLLYKSSDNGTSWAKQSASLNTSLNTLTLSGINSFSTWTAALDSLDTDGDGVPDVLDLDDDNDGLSDDDELNLYQTNPLLADTDGDGISDGDEVTNGSNPLNAPPVIAQTGPLTVTIDEDESPIAWVAPSVTAVDLNSGDTLTWSLETDGLHGTATVSGTGSTPSVLTYTPDADFYGVDYFKIKVTDGTETDYLLIKVIVNAQPEAGDPNAGGASAINNFIPYTVGGQVVRDYEGSSDPTNGGAAVQPSAIDIASCSADGAAPGAMPSTWIKYEDTDTNLATTNDAYLVLRMRLDANPSESGRNGPGLQSSHWNFMIDIDNNGSNDYIIDIDGTYASSKLDRVWLYQDTNSNNVIDDGAAVKDYIAAGSNATAADKALSAVTVTEDTSVICGKSFDFYLDVRIPVDDFPDAFANYDANVGIGVFYSSSASNTDPLQKDWQGFRDVPPDTFEAVNGGFAAPVGSVAGTVFIDDNGDDTYQVGTESAFSAQTVEILTEAGVLLTSGVDYTFVDNGDSYSVTGLAAGNYRIRNALASGYTQTTKNVTVFGAATAAIDIPTRVISHITVFTFDDLDGDGVYDDGEPSLDGVGINLDGGSAGTTSSGGLLSLDFTSNSSGIYTLSNVGFPSGYIPSSAVNVTLNYTSGSNLAVSFGMVAQGEILGVVYYDKDGDGAKDGSESGLAGVTITVRDESNAVIDSALSSADGSYRFSGLSPNTRYYVTETNPSGYVSSTSDTVPVTFSSGGSAIANFGDLESGSISGFVFSDDNGNGRSDDGEQGLQFVVITIYNQGSSALSINGLTYQPGDIVTAVLTDADGYYNVTLPEGRYRVEEQDPAGYVSVTSNSKNITLPSSQVVANFADMKQGVVTGLVFNDLNGNGVYDDGEPGVNGVVMTVTAGPVNNTTQSDGTFYFGNLADAIYTLSISVPTGFVATTAESMTVIVSDLNVNAGLQFGVKVSGTIDGEVYHDINGNLRRDPGESGIGGVLLTLDGGATTQSLVNGQFSFTGVTAGLTHTVEETDPTNYVSTTSNRVSVILDNNGKADVAAVFGDQFAGIVAGTVFEDIDANSIQDAQEQSLPGMTLSLTGFADTVSSSSGSFEFMRVSGSGLSLSLIVPQGYEVTTNNNPETINMTSYDGSSNFGLQPDATVLVYVFSDANNNGVQDGEELPLAGVTVTMTTGENGVTDANGLLRLTGISPGLNTATVSAFGGYTDTTPSSVVLYAEAGETAPVRFGKFINEAPWARPETIEVAENAAISTSLVTVVSGDNNGDSVTYSITAGNGAGKFSINPTTGEITLIGSLDYETVNSYSLTVQVSDGSLSSTAIVTINVTDVNEAPVANSQSLSTNEDVPLSITLTGSDVDGNSISYTLLSSPTRGSLTGTAPNLVYTPTANFNGSDSFTFSVNDGLLTSNIATISVTINDVNDLPVANAQNLTTNEDVPLNITLTGLDIDGTIVSYTLVSQPSHGQLSGTGANRVYTPAANYFGPDSFTFSVTDDDSGVSALATIAITVADVNDLPVANAQSLTTNEDAPLNITLTGLDVDGSIVTYTVLSNPSHGQLSGTGANLVYTPASNYFGSDSFTFRVTDDDGAQSAPATIVINVSDVNDIPVANAQSLTTNEDVPLTITLTGTDVDGTIASYTLVGQPSHGQLSGTGANRVYTPAANYFGTDSFTFSVTDDDGGVSAVATIAINVVSVNDVPVAVDDVLTMEEDGGPVTVNVLGNDIDADGDALTVTSAIASSGQVSINPDGSLRFTPDVDFNGTVTITYIISDGKGGTATATVTITVTSVNDAPVAIDDVTSTLEETPVTIDVLANDTDDDNRLIPSSVIITQMPLHGVISVSPTNGRVTYTPALNFNGVDSFSYQVSDNLNVSSNVASVTLNIIGVNDAPQAISDVVSTDEDLPVDIDILQNDVDIDGDDLDVSSIVIVQQPAHGQVSEQNGVLTFTPDTDFVGNDALQYKVADEHGLMSNVATVYFTVLGVNDAPVALDDTASLDEDTSVEIDVLANDSDIEDGKPDPATVLIIQSPQHGRVTVDPITGVVTYTPDKDYFGPDSFVYLVDDSGNASPEEPPVHSNPATVNITVNPVNDAPVAKDDDIILEETDLPVVINILGNDLDVDGTIMGSSVTIVAQPQLGTVAVNPVTGLVEYTPSLNYNGYDEFTYQVKDDQGAISNIAKVLLSIVAVNDAPVADDQSINLDEDSSVSVILTGYDIEGSALSFIIIQLPAHGTLSGDAPTLVYTPEAGFAGEDSLIFKVSDGELDSNEATVTFYVAPGNDAPVAMPLELSTAANQTLPIVLDGSDEDGDTLSYVIVTAPLHGTLTGTGPNVIYTPDADYVGADSFTYLVNDGRLDSVAVTVNINVTVAAVAFDALDDSFDVPANTSTLLDVLLNDIGPQGLLALISAKTSLGLVEVVDGKLLFTPPEGFSGVVIIHYLVRNDDGSFDTATATINVIGDANAPVVSAPAAVFVDANALYTKVDLGVATAVDRFGNPLPVSLVSGVPFFEPGVNRALWQATDADGNRSTAQQLVHVRPLISLSKDQKVIEGQNVTIGVHLNGVSPTYPLAIPYTVSGTSDSSDHTLVSGVLTITKGTEGVINVAILKDNIAESDETLIVSLSGDINMGNKRVHTITITEGNIAPQVSLNMVQNDHERLTIAKDQGLALISSQIFDPNEGDSHSYHWQVTRGSFSDDDADETSFTVDPSSMAEGLYVVQLTVTDDGVPALSQAVDIYFEVVNSLPELGLGDTDGDLIPDVIEGFADSDQDGIPNYLDSRDECNVLPEQGLEQDAFMVEGDPGVCLRIGLYTYSGEYTGAQLSDADIDKPDDELIPDPDADHVGGIFDFIARGLPEFGQSYQITLPQRAVIPDNAVYRKFSAEKGWFNFVEDDTNAVHSAQGESGFCPPPGGDVWQPGLVPGYWCVQLTISDGGPNDDDGFANGTIVDPGGVAVLLSSNQSPVAMDETVSMKQDSHIDISVLANDTDPDGDILRVLSASANFGSVVVNADNTLTFTPPVGFVGTVIITYSIADGNGGTATASVTVTVETNLVINDELVTKGGGALTLYWLLLLIMGLGIKRRVRL